MSNAKNSPAAQAQKCQFCKVKPQYYDRTGKLHLFCSKICASEGAKAAFCDHCKVRRKSKSQPFCGKKCAAALEQKRLKMCSLNGCTEPAKVYPMGTRWNYCGTRHEQLAVRGCIYCRAVLYTGDLPLCVPCNSYLTSYAPFILPVPQDHNIYLTICKRFTTSWAHPIKWGRVEVQMVYQIIPAQGVWDSYRGRRDALEAKGKYSEQGKRLGNERSLWHGTFRACSIGEPGQNVLCTSLDCSLCSVARGSYTLAAPKRNAFQRFGPGIYTTLKSSKADSYSKNKTKSTWKAILLNNVLVGSECVTNYSAPHLKGPPEGYDSVYGEPGKDLNYDELVVYTEHAIRPTHIVMYDFVSK